MRVCRYLAPGAHAPAVGIITGSTVAEIPAAGQDLGVLLLLQKAEIERLHHSAGTYHDLDSLKMLPPVGRPGKLLMLAANYHPTDARKEVDLDVETPQFFIKPSTALIAHDETIPHNPIVGGQIEEIELGAVIGRPGKNISREDAFDHIFGFTIVNDVSARSLRFSDQRSNPDRVHWFDWLNGKWLDGYCPMGPWIVPAEYLDDPGTRQPQPHDEDQRRGRHRLQHQSHDPPHRQPDRLHIDPLHPRVRRRHIDRSRARRVRRRGDAAPARRRHRGRDRGHRHPPQHSRQPRLTTTPARGVHKWQLPQASAPSGAVGETRLPGAAGTYRHGRRADSRG